VEWNRITKYHHRAWPNMLMRYMEACDWRVLPYQQLTPTHEHHSDNYSWCKMCSWMHQNSPFWTRKCKHFQGGSTAPSPTSPLLVRGYPSQIPPRQQLQCFHSSANGTRTPKPHLWLRAWLIDKIFELYDDPTVHLPVCFMLLSPKLMCFRAKVMAEH